MKKKLSIGILAFFLLCFVCAPALVYSSEMRDYCMAPPYISATVPPNVLLVADVSGSMAYLSYNIDGAVYDPEFGYEGYFDPNKMYVRIPDDATGVYYEHVQGDPCVTTCISYNACQKNSSGTQCTRYANGCSGSKSWACCKKYKTTGDCANPVSGNRLNFDNMSRIDLVRWSLTGGRPASCPDDAAAANKCDWRVWAANPGAGLVGSVCNDTQNIDDLGAVRGGCILKADNGVQIAVPWERVQDGLILKFLTLQVTPRLGIMFYSNTSVRNNYVYIGDFTSTKNSNPSYPYQNLIAELNATKPANGTPSGPAFWDAYHYFSQTAAKYGGFSPQAAGVNSDRWKNPMFDCPDKTGLNCNGMGCAKNFIMFLSDGLWNYGGSPAGSSCNIDTGYPDNSADPVVPAYLMHMGFKNVISDVDTSVSAVYALGLFIGDDGARSLQNIALYGSFNNNSKDWPSNKNNYPQTYCSVTDTGNSCPAIAGHNPYNGHGSVCTALPVIVVRLGQERGWKGRHLLLCDRRPEHQEPDNGRDPRYGGAGLLRNSRIRSCVERGQGREYNSGTFLSHQGVRK